MKNLIFLLLLPFLWTACQPSESSSTLKAPEAVQQVPQVGSTLSDRPAEIPSLEVRQPLLQISLHPDQHTWHDLDRYYREELPKHEGMPYYENLRSMVFWDLINQFDMPAEAGQVTLEFYWQELTERGFKHEFALKVRCVEALQAYWPEEKVQAAASEVRATGIAHVQAHFDEPEEYLTKEVAALNALAALATP